MHGNFIAFYENGRKREEGQYVDGVKQGRWTIWDNQGNRIRRVTFQDGKVTEMRMN
jgi:antitoxin component YwqK of YwqJK toxin-antitoxin module